MNIILLLISCLALDPVFGYKVLIYNTKFGFSHMNYMGSMADTLAKAGHEVTVLQPNMNPQIKGTGSTLAKVITVEFDEASRAAVDAVDRSSFLGQMWVLNTKNPIGLVVFAPTASNGFDIAMKNVLRQKDIMDSLRAEKFDVAIGEMFDYGGFPIFYELGIKTLIGAHSTVLTDRTAWAVGAPILPSFVPPMQSASGDDGSFCSRLSNVIFTIFSWQFERILESRAQLYMEQNHPNAPSIHQMISNLSFVFTNGEPMLDFPRPSLHKIVDLGGIGLRDPKPLDKEWIDILSKRKRNVLISFGSVAPSSLMPDSYKNGIVEMAKRFPEVTFIWKYEKPEEFVVEGADNLHLSKWTPQTDLLASGKLNLFLTHGGAGSVLESVTFGVPLIVLPLFGDQFRNALMAERFGFAHVLEKFDLPDSDKLEEAVRFGLENEDLRKAAHTARDMLASRPFSPQEKLLKHVDLAVKFGNIPSMWPNGKNLSIVQYHNLDILALFAVISVVLLIVFVFSVKCCIRRCIVKQKVKVQ